MNNSKRAGQPGPLSRYYPLISITLSLLLSIALVRHLTFEYVISEVKNIFADNMLRGALIMGALYTLKDYLVAFASFIWTVTVGTSLYASLRVVNDADNKTIYDKVCFFLSANYGDRIKNSKIDTETIEYAWLIDGTPGSTTLNFNPADGTYWIIFENAWVWLDVASQTLQHGVGFEHKPGSINSIHFHVFGWNSHLLTKIIEASNDYYQKHKEPNKTLVKQAAQYYPHGKVLTKNERVTSLDNLILPSHIEKKLMGVLDNFRDHPEIWHNHKQAHRESILLVGPPGNGKTRLISFIAGYLGYDILLLNLASDNIDDSGLLETFGKINPRTVIALEEIDAAGPQRDVKREQKSSMYRYRSVTMSGLLLALDGPVNKDGPIIVATTNRYEKLDEALIRPGRFNHHIKLDWSDSEQQQKIMSQYFPVASEEESRKFAANLTGKQISCAALVGFLRGCAGSNPPADISEVVKKAALLKSAVDVAGDRINLDSPVVNLMTELEISKQTQEQFTSRKILTLRDYKHLDAREIYDLISEEKIYKMTIAEKTALQLFQQVCEKSKDKDVLLDFDAPALPLLEKVNPEIKLALTHGGVETIRQLKRTEMDDIKKLVGDYRKHLQSQKAASEAPVVKNSDNPAPAVPTVAEKDSSVGISPSATADNTEKATIKDEKEKGKEDSGKAETESKEAKEKKDDKDDKDKPEEEVKLAHVDVVIIKDVLDMLSKAEEKSKFLNLDDLLEPYLDKIPALSATLKKHISTMGILTLRQFIQAGVDGIKSELEEVRYKVPAKDKSALTRLNSIISERIEEKEIYE